jgi:hypothetical protein
MKKITISMLVFLAWIISLTAQITREQADAIVLQYIQNEVAPPYLLYAYNQMPSANEIVITTHSEEKIKIKYACWVYYLNENPENTEPCQHRYLFVKGDDGNLLELITSNDLGLEDLSEWTIVLPIGVAERGDKHSVLIYPNPTTGKLKIMWTSEQVNKIEIFDIYGSKLHFSSRPLVHSSTTAIDISHLPAGLYFVKISTASGEIVKKAVKH